MSPDKLWDTTALRQFGSLPASEKRWLLSVAASCAATAAAINFAFLILLNFGDTNAGYAVIQKKWSLAAASEIEADVLILGDSSGDQGFVPRKFEQETGLSALNLCTFGDMLTVDDAWLLEQRIHDHSPPKQVVLIHVYDVWHRTHPELGPLRQIPISLDQWDDHSQLIPLGLPWKLRILFDRYVPSYSRRQTLTQMLWSPLLAPASVDSPQFSDRGFRAMHTPNTEATLRDRKTHIHFVKTRRFSPSTVNAAGLKRIVELCEAHSIQLWLFNSPVEAELANDRDFQEYHNRLSDWLTEQVRHYSDATVVREVYKVPISQCERVDHITAEAAIGYTRFIAQHLRNNR